MIQNRADYINYRKRDERRLGITPTIRRHAFRFLGLADEIWDFQIWLRRTEFVVNTRKPLILRLIAKYQLRRKSMRLGFSIPLNSFGPGLSLAHRGDVIVNAAARIGSDCRIHAGVNIGTAAGHRNAAPRIGDSCYLGPGVKIFGPITIGDNTAVGANAVVNSDFFEGNCSLGGIPARKISSKSAESLLVGDAEKML